MKTKKYLFAVVSMIMAFVTVFSPKVKAAEPTTGTLTIICHEQKNGDTTINSLMKGVKYTLYKVDANTELSNANSYVADNHITGIEGTTDDNGKIVYNNLELGRYFAQSEIGSLREGISSMYDSFLVDIPMTNAQGTGFNYNITVEPKIQTVYKNLEFTKVDSNGNPISGVKFKVQRAAIVDDSGNWISGEWEDYIPSGSTTALTLTTDASGKIRINNLPGYGVYTSGIMFDKYIFRLEELSSPSDKYIRNNFVLSRFHFNTSIENNVLASNLDDGSISMDSGDSWENTYVQDRYFTNYEENEDLTTVTYKNDKPTITKKVKNSAGSFVDSAGLYMTDTVNFKVSVDVPDDIVAMKTYKITDTISTGLTLDRSSVKIEGTLVNGGTEVISSDAYTLSDTGLEITFNPEKLFNIQNSYTGNKKYSDIVVTYNASFNSNVVIGGDGNVNTATLTYTNNIAENGNELSTTTISDTAEVHTGAISISKFEKNNSAKKLAGAKFKVATSKDNAKAGIFVKDKTGADIEVTTDNNGQAMIKGLAYADNGSDVSYWLVETEAPKYTEIVDGEEVEKTYKLLQNPIQVAVGKTTHNTPVQVQNSKGLNLPATGGIGIAIFMIVGLTIMTISIVKNKKSKISE